MRAGAFSLGVSRVGEAPWSWPHARGAVIGFAAAFVLLGNPLLGLAFVAFEVWWIRRLRRRGVPAGDVKAVAWTAAGAGVAVLIGSGAAFALLSAPVEHVEGLWLLPPLPARQLTRRLVDASPNREERIRATSRPVRIPARS